MKHAEKPLSAAVGQLSIDPCRRPCFNNLVFHSSSTVWDRWGQQGNRSSSHRVVVLRPPDVHVVPGHRLLEFSEFRADVPGGQQQLQPHLDGVSQHGEALARQAQAGCEEISANSRSGLLPAPSPQPLQHRLSWDCPTHPRLVPSPCAASRKVWREVIPALIHPTLLSKQLSTLTPPTAAQGRPQPTLLWGEGVGPFPEGREVPGHSPDLRQVALLRVRGVVGEVTGELRGVPALWDGCPGNTLAIAEGRSTRGEQRAGITQGRAGPVCCPQCYSHYELHVIAGVVGAALPWLPPQQVLSRLCSKAHTLGAGQLLTCGAHGELSPGCSALSCQPHTARARPMVTQQHRPPKTCKPLPRFLCPTSRIYSAPSSPSSFSGDSWGFSVLFYPKNAAVFASPIPCCLPPALFGLGFPVLLICLGETRLFTPPTGA